MILTNEQRGITVGRRPRRRKIREVTEPFMTLDGLCYPIGWLEANPDAAHALAYREAMSMARPSSSPTAGHYVYVD